MILSIIRRILVIFAIAILVIFLGFFAISLVNRTDQVSDKAPVVELISDSAANTLNFVGDLIGGNLGNAETRIGAQLISEIVWFGYKNSLILLGLALGSAILLSALLGGYAGLSTKGISVHTILMLTIVGISVPAFVVAILLQSAGIKYTTTFGRQLVSMGGYGLDYKHLLLPVLVLAARPLAYLTRHTHMSVKDVMVENYIQTAYSKGLSRNQTIVSHALKNIAIPFLAAIAVSVRFALATLPLVEFIFGWPGIGRGMLEAINNREPILFAAMALVVGLTILFINLIIDLMNRFIDPRLREVI